MKSNMEEPKKEVDLLDFPAWFHNLPSNKIKVTRTTIMYKCKLKRDERGYCAVLYHWLIGKTPVPPLAQPIINKIAKQQLNFDFKPVGK